MYAKVFASLWNGSLRGRPDDQLVLVYLLAHADDEGDVEVIHTKISDDTGLSADRVAAAIAKLESPDPRSRSRNDGGRVIEPMDDRGWGWHIINYGKYREIRRSEDRKQQNREAKQRQRASAPVSKRQHPSAMSAQVEVEVEVEAEELESTHLSADADVRESSQSRNGHGPRKAKRKPKPDSEWEQAFHEQFWPEWLKLGRACSRADAFNAWSKIPHPDLVADFNRLMDAMETAVAVWQDERRETRHYPHAATWLNDYHRNLVLEAAP